MKNNKIEKQIEAINSSKKFGCYRVYRMSSNEFNVADDRRETGDWFALRGATARQAAEFIVANK